MQGPSDIGIGRLQQVSAYKRVHNVLADTLKKQSDQIGAQVLVTNHAERLTRRCRIGAAAKKAGFLARFLIGHICGGCCGGGGGIVVQHIDLRCQIVR